MEFTELADYALPSGHLTTWVPTTRCGGEHWTVDSRPLAYVHEDHCARSTAHTGPGSWLGSVFEIHHRFDSDKLRNALRKWMLRHESFRTTVVDTVDVEGNIAFSRSTHSGEMLDIDEFPHGTLGSREVGDHIVEFFDRNLSPFMWPHCIAATITGADDADSFLLVFGADHSVMDAYSMVLAISEIRRLYEFELFGTDPALPEVGSHLDFSVRDREIGSSVAAGHDAVRTWERFLALSGGQFPAFPLPLGSPGAAVDGPNRQGSVSSWMLTAPQAEAIAAHCRDAGHNMQSAILAAMALANQELSGSPFLRYAMPMHTRHEFEYRSSVGWYVGIIPIEVNVQHADTVAEYLSAATTAVGNARELSRIPYPRVAQLLANNSTPRFAISYLDVRYVPDAEEWQRWRAHTLRSSAGSADEVYFWIVRSPAGLTISARFPPNPTASANVHRMIETFRHMLTSLAGNGTFPSGSHVHERAAS